MPGVILTSPQCGGTHAFIGLLKSLGLKLTGRHRDGVWYTQGVPKSQQEGNRITEGFEFGLNYREFATGHSGPFPTDLPVISVLRDPRNIVLCHWKRKERRSERSFYRWLASWDAVERVSTIPRHWNWAGENVLTVWYEDIRRRDIQEKIALFCNVIWSEPDFYGWGKTWSGQPSDWREQFDADCHKVWDWVWRDVTDRRWEDWWSENGRRD